MGLRAVAVTPLPDQLTKPIGAVPAPRPDEAPDREIVESLNAVVEVRATPGALVDVPLPVDPVEPRISESPSDAGPPVSVLPQTLSSIATWLTSLTVERRWRRATRGGINSRDVASHRRARGEASAARRMHGHVYSDSRFAASIVVACCGGGQLVQPNAASRSVRRRARSTTFAPPGPRPPCTRP